MKALISAVFVAVVVFFQQQKCIKVLLPSTYGTFLIVSPAKTAEPIEMIELGPRNYVLDGVQIPRGKGHF